MDSVVCSIHYFIYARETGADSQQPSVTVLTLAYYLHLEFGASFLLLFLLLLRILALGFL